MTRNFELSTCTSCGWKQRWEGLVPGAIHRKRCPGCLGTTYVPGSGGVIPPIYLPGFNWTDPGVPALYEWNNETSTWLLVNGKKA